MVTQALASAAKSSPSFFVMPKVSMKLASSTKYQIIPAIPVQRIVHPRRYYQIVMVLKLIPHQIKKVRKGLKMIPMALNGIVTINIIVTRAKTK